jgi:hypothetical protein
MDQNTSIKKINPLAGYFRQPKIYIRLPSQGKFYADGSLDISDNGEYPVYAMTAKDELMFKTPDALLSGQSTVEVIRSCIPAITDPWQMPSIDLDTALIAIRIATYGENMEISTVCPSCETDNSYEMNLVEWLTSISKFNYQETLPVEQLILHLRPYSYQEITKTNLKSFEQQRIFNVINDDNLSDEQKVEMFGKSFVKLTQLTVDIIAGCIRQIDTPEGSVSDQQMIKEFIDNSPKEVFDSISKHVSSMKDKIELKPLNAKCSNCSHEFIVPITIDQSNFFDVRS